jgi:ELWxxDGT repeat protein
MATPRGIGMRSPRASRSPLQPPVLATASGKEILYFDGRGNAAAAPSCGRADGTDGRHPAASFDLRAGAEKSGLPWLRHPRLPFHGARAGLRCRRRQGLLPRRTDGTGRRGAVGEANGDPRADASRLRGASRPEWSPQPRWLTAVGTRVYFVWPTTAWVHGREPWVSDGTAAGTHLVRRRRPGRNRRSPDRRSRTGRGVRLRGRRRPARHGGCGAPSRAGTGAQLRRRFAAGRRAGEPAGDCTAVVPERTLLLRRRRRRDGARAVGVVGCQRPVSGQASRARRRPAWSSATTP